MGLIKMADQHLERAQGRLAVELLADRHVQGVIDGTYPKRKLSFRERGMLKRALKQQEQDL